jgi:hypothetical protein
MTDLLNTHDTSLLPKVRDWFSRPKGLFIDGSWRDAASGRTFETRDPATGEVLARSRRVRPRTSTEPFVRLARLSRASGHFGRPPNDSESRFKIGAAIYEKAEELARLKLSTTASLLVLRRPLMSRRSQSYSRTRLVARTRSRGAPSLSPFRGHPVPSGTRTRCVSRSASAVRSFRGSCRR